MTTRAPVTTVIPAYNAGRYLAEALESVLSQTAVPAQIIVIDDGSTDDTVEVARRFRDVTVLEGGHGGLAAAWNRGIALAEHEYLAFLDADDVWTPGKIEIQLEVSRAPTEGPDLCFGAAVEFFSPDAPEELRRRVQCSTEPQPGLVAGTLLLRRAAFDRVGTFVTEWRVGSFVDWCARAAELGLRREVLPEVLLRRRLHGGNLGLREPEARIDFARVAKAALDRRRQRP